MALDLPPDVSAASPPAAIVAPAAQAEPIHVDSNGYHYVVNGNTRLSPAVVIAAIEAGVDPKAAMERLNAAFQQAGYFMTGLRAETSGKLVAIEVINGRITDSDIVPGLVPYFSGLMRREDVDRNTLIRDSAVAEIYSSRQGMRPRVSFGPGSEVGGTKITVTETPIPGTKPWAAALAFNNMGSRFSSRYIASAAGSLRPGNGVELTASYTQGIPGLTADSGGSQYQAASLSGSVVTPLGLYGVNWSGIAYKIGESSAPLYPTGDINTAAITGLQLLYADETSRLVANQALTHTDNVVSVFDGTFDTTNQSYSFLTLGLAYNKAFGFLGQAASMNASVTGMQGLSGRRGTFLPADPGTPDPQFALLQVSVNYSQGLPAGFTLAVNLSGQYADSSVPQNQQWVLGGYGNLSAWLPAVLVGDGGSLGRLNLGTPNWGIGGYTVSGNAFVEAGIVRFQHTPATSPTTRTLADAGVSITGNTPFGTSMTAAYALPIASRNVDLDAINRQSRANLYFTLNQAF